ncbi:MAG: hypothetical protein ABI451_00905 [Dokdonella sp.]
MPKLQHPLLRVIVVVFGAAVLLAFGLLALVVVAFAAIAMFIAATIRRHFTHGPTPRSRANPDDAIEGEFKVIEQVTPTRPM